MKFSLDILKWRLQDFYWEVRSWILPQNNDLRRAIPRKYMDLDGQLEKVVWAALVSWVEKEDGLFPQIRMIEEGTAKLKKLEEYIEFNKNGSFIPEQKIKELEKYFFDEWGHKENFIGYSTCLDDYKKLRECYNWENYQRKRCEEELKDLKGEEWHKYYEYIEGREKLYVETVFQLRGYLWT